MVPLVDVFKFNLILKQCERDNKAFETLFDFYYPRIKLHIHKKFPDACADDVAQEFFLQLMKSHGFKYVQNPTAWVFACCDNIAKRMLIGESATLPLLVSENYSVSEDLVETEILNDQAKRVSTLWATIARKRYSTCIIGKVTICEKSRNFSHSI